MKTFSLDAEVGGNSDKGGYKIEPASNTLDPEEKTIRDQKIEVVRKVVTFLKPRYKRLIELRYFEEYSYQEISEEMNLPLGTVKAQLFRAKELLYEILKNRKGSI